MDNITIILATLIAVVVTFQLWKRFTVLGNIYTLTKSSDTLDRSPEGESKRAFDRLVKIGSRALPTLQARNLKLIGQHERYSNQLKSGSFWNPYDNYGAKSDSDKRYRYVIEIKQARVVDVIEEIERAGGSG